MGYDDDKKTCGSCYGSGSKTEVGTEIGVDFEGNTTVNPTTTTKTCSECGGSGKVRK